MFVNSNWRNEWCYKLSSQVFYPTMNLKCIYDYITAIYLHYDTYAMESIKESLKKRFNEWKWEVWIIILELLIMLLLL